MDKETLKSLLSVLCIVSGVLLGGLTFYYFPNHEGILLANSLFSFIFILVGMTSWSLSSKRKELISRLKTGEHFVLSRWLYKPNIYRRVKDNLHEHFVIQLSIIFLVAILGILLVSGAMLNYPWFSAPLGSFMIAAIVVLCLTSYVIANAYYKYQLNRFHECIIATDYFYFNSELHGLQKGFYALGDVQVILDDTYYLQFIYSTPGTPYGPFEIINIPIPTDHLENAYKIQSHYLKLISETDQ